MSPLVLVNWLRRFELTVVTSHAKRSARQRGATTRHTYARPRARANSAYHRDVRPGWLGSCRQATPQGVLYFTSHTHTHRATHTPAGAALTDTSQYTRPVTQCVRALMTAAPGSTRTLQLRACQLAWPAGHVTSGGPRARHGHVITCALLAKEVE